MRVVQEQVVRHERRVEHALHHRVPTGLDGQPRLVGQFRPHVVQLHRALGQVRQHVHQRDRRSDTLQVRQFADQRLQQLVVELLLALQCALARAEHLVLELLQLGRDEPLGVLHRLAAVIVGRHALRVAALHLDEVALHAVVTDLQRRDAGPLPFLRLQLHQPGVGVGGDGAALVQLRVVAFRDHPSVAQQVRRRPDDGPHQQPVQVGAQPQPATRVLKQGGVQPGQQPL